MMELASEGEGGVGDNGEGGGSECQFTLGVRPPFAFFQLSQKPYFSFTLLLLSRIPQPRWFS